MEVHGLSSLSRRLACRAEATNQPAFAEASAGNLRDQGWLANRSAEGAKIGASEGKRTLVCSLGSLTDFKPVNNLAIKTVQIRSNSINELQA
jgi:hypothetical protein